MNILKKLLLLFCFFSINHGFSQHLAIGHWREHLPYNNCIAVTEAGTRVYCATPFSIFYYDKEDQSLQRISKINGLSDIGISAMRYNSASNTVLVAYTNANLDLITPGGIVNISDIKRKAILGDKSIYNITYVNNLAYLSCGFGIVVVDMLKQEVKDTYYIGNNGALIKVNDIATDGTNFYAATVSGVFQANASNPNLAYYQNWAKLTTLPYPDASYNLVEYFAGKLIVNKNSSEVDKDTLLVYDGNQWSAFRPEYSQTRNSLKKFNNRLLITYRLFVMEVDENMTQLRTISEWESAPLATSDAILDNSNNIWIADQIFGLIRYKQYDNYEHFLLNGPASQEVFAMDAKNNSVWAVPGARDVSQGNAYRQAAIYGFLNDDWVSFTSTNVSGLDSLYDFINVAIDPTYNGHVFINSFGKGLVEMYDNKFIKVYNASNSPLQGHYLDPSSIRVGGIDFDEAGNLWSNNSFTSNGLHLRTASGAWYSYYTGNYLEFGSMVHNNVNQLWMLMPRGSDVMVYDHNGTLTNGADDRKKIIDVNYGNDVACASLLCIANDLNGDIWIGTDKGVKVCYNPGDAFTGNYTAQTILLEQDGHWQYLLETEIVSAIAVDGANRKWFGTEASGVYLMSSDGTQLLEHFTETNSPLLSNEITSITINQSTGEVFFGTSKGIISYKSTATGGGEKFEAVYAYPNPVKHDYNGIIAIKGLVLDADVKITDVTGNLVYKTKAIGGQAIWDGHLLNGERARTGIYLVFCTNEDGSQTDVTKILFEN